MDNRQRKQLRKRERIGAACLAGLLLLAPVTTARAEENAGEEALASMKQVADNGELELFFDEEGTGVAVRVKETGDIWFSNPPGATEDQTASAYYQNRMQGQFSVQYFNENVQAGEMDNYNDSIVLGQFETSILDNGVKVTYTLGKQAQESLLPMAIREERMLSFTEKMEEKAAKKLLRNYTLLDGESMKDSERDEMLETYPGLAEYRIYVMKEGTKDYIKEELEGYFIEAGYTKEDKELDDGEGSAGQTKQNPWFQVPLTYTLDGESLLVTVDPEEVSYNTEGFYLTSIQLMEYFGAADSGEEGYLFVPDGSGALIYLNNGKSNVPAYHAQVYGEDNTFTFMKEKKSEVDDRLTIKLPVFGLKAGDKAWMAVIEDGDGYADITAQVSGMYTSYNNVFASFRYLQYGGISLDEIIGGNNFNMYSQPVFSGKYQLRYSFLHGEEADYSGMAIAYRNYLEERGNLQVREQAKGGMFLDLVGAIEKYHSTLGVKYRSTEALTTFAQAEEIVSRLQEAGVDRLSVKYSGWAGGGLRGSAAASDPEPALKRGGTKLSEYLEDMKGRGVPVFLDADFQYVYRDGLFDGYNALSQSPKYFDNTNVTCPMYRLSTQSKEGEANLISPYFISSVTEKFAEEISGYGTESVSVGKAGSHLFSDLNQERYVDRQDALARNRQALCSLAEEYGEGLLGENANAYALRALGGILETPMDCNKYRIIDQAVPFYQMVVKGYLPFTGEALNMADDYETTLLKSVECGAGIYFRWCYEDNSAVVNTDFDDLYSIHYGNWVQRAAEDYGRLQAVYQGLEGQRIIKHETVQEGVTLTTYENGTQIAVNFGREEVIINGCVVGARDFMVVKER